MQAITGIHNSTKSESDDQIGKFGVGFKSVFVYSQAPEVTSGEFAFRISRLVMPEPIDRPEVDAATTRFWLPFNNPKKQKADAFSEVADGLRQLAETTLLFLSSINAINWRVNGHEHGAILRIEHTDEHIEVLKETEGAKTASSHFLRFNAPVEGLERHNLSVAFALEPLSDGKDFIERKALNEQFKIIPQAGQVAVFFPADKETSGLRFHLHAPFVPELSRASIKSTPANIPLFAQLATLAAKSMHGVRDLGFLTPDFLGVLPNPQDTLGKPYEPIRDALVAAFNNEPLMPTYAKVHAPAKHLLQAKAALKELLTAADLELILDHRSVPPLWAANRALQGTNVERFMNGLALEEWDVGDFLEFVSDQGGSRWSAPEASFMSWLGGKPVEWFQQLYALLAQPDTEDELYQLKESKIIKLIDGKLGVAAQSYFLDEDRRYVHIVPCVDPAIYESGKSKVQQKFSRKFLEAVGVKEVGEQELVKSLLDNEYSTDNHALNEKDYVAHLRRFIKLSESNVSSKGILANYKIFLGSDGKWHKPCEIFLDRPFVDTGLTDYYEVVGGNGGLTSLASFYDSLPIDISKVVALAKFLDAVTRIEPSRANCMNNPRWSYLSSVYGQRSTSPMNIDYVIKHFDKLVAAKSVRIARLIWDSLNSYGQNPPWLEARYRKNATGGSKYADSQVIHQLREAEWIPQSGEFVKPSQARADLLPEGFLYDPGISWLKKVEFGKAIDLQNEQVRQAAEEAAALQNRKLTAAAEFGFESPEDIARLEKLSKVPADELERLIADWERSQIPIELPENEPRNPERRAQKVGALAATASARTTEMRTRSVSVGRDAVKDEARQYLRQQYAKDGELFCQVCKRPMPFRLDDGTEYFEAVQFSKLAKHYHQNYLALCPNDAAKFIHANGTDELLIDLFLDLNGSELEVILAQKDETIYFTKTHIVDLQKVIEVDRDGFDDEATLAS